MMSRDAGVDGGRARTTRTNPPAKCARDRSAAGRRSADGDASRAETADAQRPLAGGVGRRLPGRVSDAAMRQFQSVQAREAESAHRAALPLVEALAGLDESLLRGVRALEITHRQLTETAPQQLRQGVDDEFQRLPWWRRWWIRKWHAAAASTRSHRDGQCRG